MEGTYTHYVGGKPVVERMYNWERHFFTGVRCPGCDQEISVDFEFSYPSIECGGGGNGSCDWCWVCVTSPKKLQAIKDAQEKAKQIGWKMLEEKYFPDELRGVKRNGH